MRLSVWVVPLLLQWGVNDEQPPLLCTSYSYHYIHEHSGRRLRSGWRGGHVRHVSLHSVVGRGGGGTPSHTTLVQPLPLLSPLHTSAGGIALTVMEASPGVWSVTASVQT
jgi:hypothetical protein